MKTFTTYAEKKAKQFLNLLQGYTKGIRITAILILLLMGVNSAWADITFTGGYIYFDNSIGINQTYIQLCARQGSWTGVSTMTNISNTKLYYVANPQGSNWGGILGWVVIGNSSQKTNSNFDNWSTYGWCSDWNTFNFYSGSTYLIVPTSTSKSQSVNTSYLGGGYSALNSQQTIKSAVNDADANSKATISITSYKMTGNGKVTEQTATLGTGAKDTYVDAARTATTTLTVGDVATGYQFDGWYTAATGGTQLSNKKTYTYYPTEATTVYARFSTIKYTVTYGVHSSGNGTLAAKVGSTSISSGDNVNYGSKVVFTATPSTGYEIEGWYSNADCTTSLNNGTDKTYTIESLTAAATVYVKFKRKQHTVNFGVHSSGNGTLTAKVGNTGIDFGDKVNYGSEVVFTAKPDDGYQIEGWYSNSTCTTPIDNGTNDTYTVTITGGTNVYVKFKEIPQQAIYLVGEFSWDAKAENKFTETATPGIYTLTKHFDARDRHQTTQSQAEYEFKLQVDGTKYTVEGNGNAKVLQYTRQSQTKKVNDGTNYTSDPYYNLLLQADMTGDYTFTYNSTTKELTVTHPAYTPEAAYVVGDFSDGQTGTDALPKDEGAGYDWTEEKGIKFDNDNTAEICFNGTGKKWEFKIKINGVWYGAKDLLITGDGKYTLTDDYAFQSETNCAIQTSGVNGCYTFSYTEKGNGEIELTVGFPKQSENPTTVYLKPNDDWKKDNARFAVHYWQDGKNPDWVDMTDMGCNGDYYQAEIPAGYSNLMFVQMKPNTTNNWENKGSHQTGNLTVPTNGNNLYDVDNKTLSYLHLKPNSNWKDAGARFAAYFFGNGETWVSMEQDRDDYYTCEIPTNKKYPNVILCRMNPNTTANNWSNKWDQTNDLTIPTNGNNLYTVKDGAWSNGDGTWSRFLDNSQWTTYTEPTYDVTINITGKGSIVINGQTYEGTTEETTTLTIEDIVVNQPLTVTAITPANRWYYEGDATITIGSNEQEPLKIEGTYEICGPTTINLDFMQKYCLVTFHPNPPKGVLYPGQIGSQEVRKGDKIVQPTVVDLDGYLFGGWYPNGSEYTDANKFDFDTPVEQDLELCARWVPYEQCIFFKNNLNWDNIYVYTFSNNVWHNGTDQENPNDDMGVQPKVNHIEHGLMTQIGYTDVYYYILTSMEGFNFIAFSDFDMSNYDYFHEHNAIYRSDRSDQMQLFIPQREGQVGQKRNNTYYYSEGIWMKYNSTESGYKWSSDKNGWSTDINPFTAPNKGGYSFTTKVSLEGGKEYLFKINNIKNDWYSEVHTFTQEECTDRWFKVESDPNKNAIIQPNATGEYLFTIYLGDGKVMVSLEYPLGIGDYRLAYKDNTADSFHPGHYIRKRSTGTHRDTTSFFIFHDKTPIILLQQCTDIKPETGEVTWQTLKRYACTGNNTTDDNPNNAMLPGKKNADGELLISGSSCGVDKTTVYNFVLLQEDGNEANLATSETHLYTGEFYIRTDDAPGGWDYFRQTANQMTFSSYAQQHEHFDHYFCKWIHKDKNVRYTVANDYSYCISDTLFADDIIGGNNGTIEVLPVDANVRFMWDSRDNSIGRAYIAGSSNQADRFLVVEGKNDGLKDAAGNNLLEGQHGSNRYGLKANEEILKDMGNWIYQVDVKANKDALIKLTALYNGTTQYFKGTEGKEDNAYIRLLASDATDTYKIRLIYDFKVNQLIIAWLVDNEDIEEDMVLGADMMIIRHNQGRATQINFNNATDTIKNVEKAYAVMTFDKYFLNNRTYPNADGEGGGNTLPNNEQLSAHARALYWISFPFNVKLSDVSGFGEYGDYWILEYYDGADRAKNGLWVDTDTYWKYITNPNYIIQAGQGYVLSLNLNKMGFESTVFSNTAEVSLFFPSTDSLHIITHNLPTAVEVPAHECTIEREKGIHKIYDSHWNMIGVPGFADIENVEIGKHLFTPDSLYFYYEYQPQSDEYTTKRGGGKANFQIMYSYMVQYHGIINWSTKSFSAPSAMAARRVGELPSQYDLRLELGMGDQIKDQTFVLLDEDKRATMNYDLNLDLTKIMNKNASIYTLAGEQRIMLSGNTLPIAKATVPVGVVVTTAGEYTFRMPDGTDGISAILVDNQTGAHTNMLLDEYTVILEAGTYENRFSLVLDPQRTSTEVENIGDGYGDGVNGNGNEGIKKYIIDGQLFIRTANGLFDAKGQRM